MSSSDRDHDMSEWGTLFGVPGGQFLGYQGGHFLRYQTDVFWGIFLGTKGTFFGVQGTFLGTRERFWGTPGHSIWS